MRPVGGAGWSLTMRSRTRLVVPLAVVALVLATGVPAASAAKPAPAGKTYTASVSPDHVAAAGDTVLSLVNSGDHPFGSAELQLPTVAGLSVSHLSADGWSAQPPVVVDGVAVVDLISSGTGTTYAIQPGGQLDVTIHVADGTADQQVTLGTAVKQSNDFSGVGNDFTNTGQDPVLYVGAGPAVALVFDQQPTSVQVSGSTAVTSSGVTPVLSMCPAPAVHAVDSAGNTVRTPRTIELVPVGGLVLNGSLSAATDAGGIATFGTCSVGVTSASLGTFTLKAQAGVLSVESDSFEVLPTYGTCADTCSVSGLTGAGGTVAGLVATPGSAAVGSERLRFSGDSWSADELGQCGGIDALNPYRDAVRVDFANHDKSVTLRWSKKAVQWATNNGSSQWQVCLASDVEFTGSVSAGSWWIGTLQQCGSTDVAPTDPCVTDLRRTAKGEQLATVILPDRPGDPRMI